MGEESGPTAFGDDESIADIAFTPSQGPHGGMIQTPCCPRMADDLNRLCAVHADRSDCPDAFVSEINGGYGLMVHDGGSSAIKMAICPWCGAGLPPIDR